MAAVRRSGFMCLNWPAFKKYILKKILLHKVLTLCISIVTLLMFLVPHATVFIPDDRLPEDEYWQDSYILSDEISSAIYIPFVLVWVVFLFLKKGMLRAVFKFTLLCLSGFYFLMAAATMMMPAQDLVPNYGVIVTMMLFPLLVFYMINNQSLTKAKAEI